MEALEQDDPATVGPFALLGRLGAGGMGTVYLGRSGDGAMAAVKVLHSGFAADVEFRRRFAREVAVARTVRGHGLVPLLDGDAEAPRPWLATEYVESRSLNQVVEDRGPLSEPEVTVLGRGLADALAQLHAQGVVHRDLAPSNVLITDDGPRLIDFGVARSIGESVITATGAVLGTPAFMSPEQAGGTEIRPASDVFSLAAVLVFAATGAGPYGHETDAVALLRHIRDDEPDLSALSPGLRSVLEPCLAKDPTTRPDAASVAAQFGARRRTPTVSPLSEWDPPTIGPYRLLGLLGAGGMGKVYLGEEPTADGPRQAAVKVVHEQFAADQRFRERFAREVAVARAVQGPRVAQLIDAEPDARVPWLATEYVSGPSLEQAVAGATLPEHAVLRLAAGLAEALAAMHARGIVHRDLKPSNVLLALDGPKLIDFGIARAFDEAGITRTGGVLGAPGFMSPEQAAGHDVGPASDVFSLASVVVFAAIGRGPFGTSTTPLALLRRVIDDAPDLTGLSPRLAAIVEPCLAKQPDDRPTAAELVDLIAAAPTAPAVDGGTRVLQAPEPERRRRGIGRRGLLIGAGLVGAAAAGGVGLVLAARSTPRAARWVIDVPGPATLDVAGGVPYLYGSDRVVRAVAPRDGSVTWTYALQDDHSLLLPRFRATPAACYVDDEPGLSAVDTSTGLLRWAAPATFLVTADVDVVVAFQLVDDAWSVVGLDPATGTRRWAAPTGLPHPDGAAVLDGRVFVSQEAVTAFDAGTGAQLWQQPRAPRGFSWTVSGAGLFLTDGRQAVALDPATGTIRWRRDLPDPPFPAEISPTTYATGAALCLTSAGGQRAQVWSTDTGQLRWQANDPDPRQPSSKLWLLEPQSVGNADVIFFAERGFDRNAPMSYTSYTYRVTARSAANGDILWTVPLISPSATNLEASLALDGNTLFALLGPRRTSGTTSTTGGTLHAFDLT
ncbi:protein kinase domain-containing protein [Pseudonocardia sp. CA-107938]|uniref:serine/threonine-protein kinase n=1 Tax=Pseudonocardia sp. CA-107938 TaxID=3240021 RepID=UPI003D8CEF2E